MIVTEVVLAMCAVNCVVGTKFLTTGPTCTGVLGATFITTHLTFNEVLVTRPGVTFYAVRHVIIAVRFVAWRTVNGVVLAE